MSTTLDEAREAAAEAAENFRNEVQTGRSFIDALLTAAREEARVVFREEIAQLSRAPVGEDAVTLGCGCVFCDLDLAPETDENGRRWHHVFPAGVGQAPKHIECSKAPTPPAKDTGEVEAGASVIHETISYMIAKAAESDGLRQRLAEAHADARAAWDCCELRRKEAEAGQTRIADLEARLAEAEDQASETRAFIALFGAKPAEVVGRLERERDEARSSLETERVAHMSVVRDLNARVYRAESSLETAERRIGELEEALRLARNRLQRAAVDHQTGTEPFYRVSEWADEASAALTPDAGTARSAEAQEG